MHTDCSIYSLYVPTYAIEIVSIELPAGAENDSVVAVDIPNHAGLSIAPSLLSSEGSHEVEIFLDGTAIPEAAYSVSAHADGSVSFTLSNTYLLSLGSGTYDFRAQVDGQEILFSVCVTDE